MSWMSKLCETYEAGLELDLPDEKRLMPTGHTLQNAHIKIVIDINGVFKRAQLLDKEQIILPATEKSANARTGRRPPPHPFADKIQYVAKTYASSGGQKPSFFKEYLQLLEGWSSSQFAHPKVKAVYSYVYKGEMIDDLVREDILIVDTKGSLLCPTSEELKDSYDSIGSDRPRIFRILPKDNTTNRIDQGNALVCWSVEIPGEPYADTWKDKSIYDSWIHYGIETSGDGKKGFCYVTGKQEQIIATNHPAKLRNTGDSAKLISSNDSDGYTFRGRFTDNKESLSKSIAQSVSVSVNATQKAHNALQWLIKRQGFRNEDQVIVAWAVSGTDIPNPLHDSFSFLIEEVDEIEASPSNLEKPHKTDHSLDMGQYFSTALRKRLYGFQAKLPETDNIIVMGLDSATPGRMAITYYQDLTPQEFFDRLAKWYEDFSWFQRRSVKLIDKNGKEKFREQWLPGTPPPKEIAEAIFGDTISDSLKKNTVERLLPCIIENLPLPRDFSEKAFHRAVNRQSYKSNEQWLWEKNLGIACSLFKGFCKRNTNHKREYSMALEEDNCSRDYLFGRLLAIAERIEEVALSVADENRSTTAARLMQRFADRPASTWRSIELSLQPYIQRLRSKRAGFLYNQQKLLDEIMGKFQSEDFSNDKSLSGEFLLAFHTQRLDLRTKSESNNENEVTE